MITIELKSGIEPKFQPGDSIAGNVRWADLPESTEDLEVRLIWFTIGKGDQDSQFVDVKKVNSPSSKGFVDFEFVAPHRPNSFAGKLIALEWAVEVIAFPQREAEQAKLTISPAKGDLVLKPVESENVFWKQWTARRLSGRT
ncbi:hypothetical protein OAG71_00815 [bacterium]|nr:hypothetical protein [bacterium]